MLSAASDGANKRSRSDADGPLAFYPPACGSVPSDGSGRASMSALQQEQRSGTDAAVLSFMVRRLGGLLTASRCHTLLSPQAH